ncbi:hypothetical protein [Halobacterium sp. KA-6]
MLSELAANLDYSKGTIHTILPLLSLKSLSCRTVANTT